MKMFILTMRDIKANLYLPPIFVPNIYAAQREISDNINNSKSNEAWITHPEDFELIKQGTWDSDTGEYELLDTPQQVCALATLKNA